MQEDPILSAGISTGHLWVARVVPNHRGVLSCWVAEGSRLCGHLSIFLRAQRFFYMALFRAGAVVVRRTFHRGLEDAGRV